MNKLLLTCFLALLCLVGRYLAASSKVADSPGAGLLHRSASVVSPHSGDTHRGGAILPDPYLKYPNGAEISSPPLLSSSLLTVDGGPSLRSPVLSTLPTGVGKYEASVFGLPSQIFPRIDFGIVDSDQDMRVGEQTNNLDPALVTVSDFPKSKINNPPNQLSLELSGDEAPKLSVRSRVLSTVDRGPKYETVSLRTSARSDDTNLPTPVSGLPSPHFSQGFSLVDDSTSQGQEGSISSAQVGDGGEGGFFDSLETARPVVVYVETKSLNAVDSLQFIFWDPYLNEYELPYPDKSVLKLSSGNMYEGSMGASRGQWESAPISGYGRLSVRFGKYIYLDRFLVQPGDSVRVRFDFNTAQMLFSGPAAEKFKLQYQLALAYENYMFDQDPTMFTHTSDFWGYSEKDSLMILDVKNQHSSIRRKMEYISSGKVGLEYLIGMYNQPLKDHPGFGVLDAFRGKVPDEFWEILHTDLIGRLNFDRMSRFSTYYAEDSVHREFFREHIQNQPVKSLAGMEHSVYYPEFVYQQQAIVSALTKSPFSQLVPELPSEIGDLVFAKFIVKNYRRFKDSNKQFELALDLIQTPWLKEEIQRLYAAQRIGEPIAEIPLLDENGNQVSLRDLEGKTLFISFWLPGCHASSGAYEALVKPTQEALADEEGIEFIYIALDRDWERFLSNVDSGVYSDPTSLNLNAPGPPNPFMEHYRIHAFPTFMVVDQFGFVQNIGNIPDTVPELSDYLKSIPVHSDSSPH